MDGTFVEQLRQYFDNKGITQKQIAEKLEVNPAYINKLLTGKKAFGKKTAQQFQDLFGLSMSWLLTGDGEMLSNSSAQASTSDSKRLNMAKNQTLADLIKTIKYKSNLNQSEIAAAIGVSKQYLSDTINGRFPFTEELKQKLYGQFTYLTDKEQEMENLPRMSYTKGKPYYNVDFTGGFDIVLNDQTVRPDYLIDFKKYREADCWCNITGHSMEPLISNGDIIAIKELKNWQDFILYGEAYGIVTEDMRTVKIVTKSEKGDGYLHLVPVNKSTEYQPQDIPIKLITHVFKILGCMKKL